MKYKYIPKEKTIPEIKEYLKNKLTLEEVEELKKNKYLNTYGPYRIERLFELYSNKKAYGTIFDEDIPFFGGNPSVKYDIYNWLIENLYNVEKQKKWIEYYDKEKKRALYLKDLNLYDDDITF